MKSHRITTTAAALCMAAILAFGGTGAASARVSRASTTKRAATGPEVLAVTSPTHPYQGTAYPSRDVTVRWEGQPVSYHEGEYGWPDRFDGSSTDALGLEIRGNLAYVGTGSRGLRILDVSDKSNPRELGGFEVPDIWLTVSGLAVQGTTAACVCWWPQGDVTDRPLLLVDASDPTSPTAAWMGWCSFDGNRASSQAVATDSDYLYMSVAYANPATSITEWWLSVWDISTPASPQIVGDCKLKARVSEIVVKGDYLFLSGDKLQVVNVANPASPSYVRYLDQKSNGAAADNEYLYAGSWEDSLVFDIRQPASPQYVGVLRTMITWMDANSVRLSDTDPSLKKHYAYIGYFSTSGAGHGYVQVQDISRPMRVDNESLLGNTGWLEEDQDLGVLAGIESQDSHVYLTRNPAYGREPSFVIMHVGPQAYSYVFDRNPTTAPDTVEDGNQTGLVGEAKLTASSDGDWYFHVRAVDDHGQWGPAVHRKIRIGSGPPELVGSTVNMTAPATVGYGGSATLAGKLKSELGSPLGGLDVRAEKKAYNATSWTLVGTKATDDEGSFEFTVKPTVKTSYRVRFLGDGDYSASSALKTVAPKASVSNPAAPATMYRTRYSTVSGYLKPRHTAGTYAVKIYKYRYVSGHWKSYGYVSAKVANYSSYSKYSVSTKLPYAGKWRLRAYHADAGHAASWSSGYDNVTVK